VNLRKDHYNVSTYQPSVHINMRLATLTRKLMYPAFTRPEPCVDGIHPDPLCSCIILHQFPLKNCSKLHVPWFAFLVEAEKLRFDETSSVIRKTKTTLSNGYLGSRNDEERSEMRYVMRIAELSESSNL
jgi:hypothetical protein